MNKIFSIIPLITVCLFLPGCKEPTDLVLFASGANSITVYDLEGLKGEKYSKQDLDKAFQAPFDLALFQELATLAKFKSKWVMWMGSSLAVVKMKDGTERQLALSYYGGFFRILGEDGYFYFEGEGRKKFEKAFSKEIIHDNFFPKRIARNKKLEEEKH